MSENKKQMLNWKKYAFEMLSIIVGVLVALAVDEWNEDRENNARAQIALGNIKKEVRSNLDVLKLLHPRNLEAYAVVQSESTADDTAQIVPGLQLQDVAWKTFMSNGISVHVEYDNFYTVAEIYSIQQIYKDLSNSFIRQIMSTRSLSIANGKALSDSEIITSSVELLALLISVEEQLQTHLEQYLGETPEANSL